MARKLLKAVAALMTAATILLTLAAVWALLTARPDRPASVLGFSPMVVVSGSMEPEFPVGTFLLSRRTSIDRVEEGDIIVFYGTVGATTGIITHRVVEKTGEGEAAVLTTKGDANSLRDPDPVTKDNLLGRVVWHSPLLGKVIAPLRNEALRPLFLAIPAALLACEGVSFLKDRKKDGSDEKEDEEESPRP